MVVDQTVSSSVAWNTFTLNSCDEKESKLNREWNAFLRCFESLDTHNLRQQNVAALQDRVDDKFVVCLKDLPEIMSKCEKQYTVLMDREVKAFPYKTVYYDDDQLSCFYQHHNGVKSRFKLRSREYVHSDLMFLETKIKTNKDRTLKFRVPMPHSLADKESVFFIRQLIHRNLDEFRPVLNVDYYRTTLINGESNERVTLDHQLTFVNRATGKKVVLNGVVVIEIKQPKSQGSTIMHQLLKKKGYRPMNFSKYCVGSLLTEVKGIKHNQFKPCLMQLDSVLEKAGASKVFAVNKEYA